MIELRYAAEVGADLPLDRGITFAVKVLRDAAVETFESYEGGITHAFPEPTVRFHGELAAGWHALGAALTYGLPVAALRRYWAVIDGEPAGPHWEITFRAGRLRDVQQEAERSGLIS